ncbi:MAG: ChaN family lipoprotein [Acidobacteria bacterium]|nr:ChaN family lipoprotein [Acidobacteriota bacterium]
MMKDGVRRLSSILLFTALAAQLAAGAQGVPPPHYRAFDAKGNAVTLQAIVASLGRADVLFVGETHDDAVAHLLEAELLRRADEAYGASSAEHRSVALSLEMFERDVQTVLDEYLAGLITERHFLLSSRPWRNYETDYRPLVEYAREHHLPVIAANAPARYVSRVSSNGPDSLKSLPQVAIKSWLPPLPFPPASEGYAAKFNRFMGGEGAAGATQASAHGGLHLLEAQTLRDASMAYSISEYLKRGRDPLVVQVNGTFHSEERMGVPEQLARYRKQARAVVVTIVPADSFPNFEAGLGRLGDFVIITDPAVKTGSGF